MASNPVTAAPTAPVFDYTQYQNPSVSVTFLDNAANAFVAAAGGSFLSKIWAGVVLVVACAYIWGRDKLITQQMLIQKQQYELAQTQGEGGEVNGQAPDAPVTGLNVLAERSSAEPSNPEASAIPAFSHTDLPSNGTIMPGLAMTNPEESGSAVLTPAELLKLAQTPGKHI